MCGNLYIDTLVQANISTARSHTLIGQFKKCHAGRICFGFVFFFCLFMHLFFHKANPKTVSCVWYSDCKVFFNLVLSCSQHHMVWSEYQTLICLFNNCKIIIVLKIYWIYSISFSNLPFWLLILLFLFVCCFTNNNVWNVSIVLITWYIVLMCFWSLIVLACWTCGWS